MRSKTKSYFSFIQKYAVCANDSNVGAQSVNLRDQPIALRYRPIALRYWNIYWSRNIRQRTCAINGSCGNGLARPADCAGKVLHDRQELFYAIGRLCRNGFARSDDCAGIVWPWSADVQGPNSQRCKIDRNCKSIVVANLSVTSHYKSLWWYCKFVLQWIGVTFRMAPPLFHSI